MTAITYDTFFIDGKWAPPASDRLIELHSPSTLEHVGTVPDGVEGDIDRAVQAARTAFDDPNGWSTWTPEKRSEVLEAFAAELFERADEIAQRVAMQNGMPVATADQIEAVFPSALLSYYGEFAKSYEWEERRPGILGGTALVTRKPLGVLGLVVPWNFPTGIAFLTLAPALAAGNTVVLKPPPETVLNFYSVAEAMEAAGLPPGVVNIVQGGRETGAYLVAHPGVDHVAFTGSTAAGRKVGESCGKLLKPVTLELGGKSAAIVLDDADLEASVDAMYTAMFFNNGQTCWLNSRILAPKGRYDDVVSHLVKMSEDAIIGDALDPQTQIGPMVSARQRDRVLGYIEKGIEGGARVATGGGPPAGLGKGYFVQPTVFADVDMSQIIAREEIFGPVLSVIPYEDIDDAVRIANDTEYGLGGSVWTQDPNRGIEIARRVRSGTIGINHYMNEPAAPFGGVKSSGLGSELGPEGFAHQLESKSIYLDGSFAPSDG